ncbi:DUF551 domain-containing protein [Raoultella planticola]|uniref:DUF551 domain-containing protein n=1 Tax=Raoultella planticola TaxID=575 RepID=UPI003D011EA6
MTSKLTRERIELIANFHRAMTLPPSHDEIEELARMALAAMDSEAVAVPDHLTYLQNPTLENVLSDAEENSPMAHAARILACEVKFWRSAPLYRHAQPAPVVTFYRDGIEDAAKWIDQQRELYDNEHGWSDPDTGAFEFASDVQRGYSSTLEELAEGIRALHPNAGNSPVIPDRWITVSERLPNKNQSVLILVDFDSSFVEPLICTARFTGSTFRRGDATIKPGSGVEKVTYWMPLPAAPKQENI